jgi:secondary thiamine-phosphate synthase enzyme
MDSTEVDIPTGDRLVTDLTDEVEAFARDRGDGLLHVFVPHATAGVALMELGSGSERDLESLIERVLPRDVGYAHRHGSRGHGRDHVLPAFVSPSVILPVLGGRVQLGTWQSVVLVDSNADNATRHVRLSFVTG